MFYRTCIACVNNITFQIGHFCKTGSLLTRKTETIVRFVTRLCNTLLKIWLFELMQQCKYLGLILHEHLDYNITAKAVAQSASRALGLLIAKAKANGGFPFGKRIDLRHSGMFSILICSPWYYIEKLQLQWRKQAFWKMKPRI